METSKNTPGLLMRFFQWFFCWKTFRRGTIGLVGLVTLITLFYTVENWRGKRAWEKCKRELEAKGQMLDWAAYIPAPIPDEENIFKAPKMTEWFVGRGSSELSQRLDTYQQPETAGIAAELTIVLPGENLPQDPKATFLRLDDPTASERAAELVLAAIGPSLKSPRDDTFLTKPLQQIKPAHLIFQAQHPISRERLINFFPLGLVTNNFYNGNSRFFIGSTGSNTFHLQVFRPSTAVAYLIWSDQFGADFDLIRKALKRPYARIEGDYVHPYEVPIPKFVALRSTAQMLASRAQCYLLLHQPEKALQELTLMHDLSRLLRNEPTDKFQTLAEAMIKVAIAGVYVNTIADGLRLHEWQEAQLATIQEQLKGIDLPPSVKAAFQSERAAFCHVFKDISRTDLKKVFSLGPKESINSLSMWSLTPRGWFYQNMVTDALLLQNTIDIFSPTDGISPSKSKSALNEYDKACSRFAPGTWLMPLIVPNFTKAVQQCAKNQTLVNQALIACALERYHLAHSQYPETLNDLVPQFLEKLPHDIIKGQPLVYQRTENGRFLLYSVGWDENDDGGNAEKDWVWGGML